MLEDQTTNTGNTSIRCLNLEVDGTADCPLYHGDTILGFVDWLIWISGLSHKTGLGHSDSPVVRTLRYKPPVISGHSPKTKQTNHSQNKFSVYN
ncbi:hypothetical protein LSH36_246g01078 [Paralvinella palmiformis]|uniref:Uncharacterized protein n=1 Tax=Paralvinella palmiformis TaxID=53620 RepID=A0AAD9JLB7_9ANNE|nr:hypothetical protein LSH36_246g01078 [Paralvinella palmiformis]